MSELDRSRGAGEPLRGETVPPWGRGRCGSGRSGWLPEPAPEGVELTGDNGLLTGLVRQVLQTGWRSR